MRAIFIEVQTDSDYDIDFITNDVKQELGCCSTRFDTDTIKVAEINLDLIMSIDRPL